MLVCSFGYSRARLRNDLSVGMNRYANARHSVLTMPLQRKPCKTQGWYALAVLCGTGHTLNDRRMEIIQNVYRNARRAGPTT